MPRKRSAAQVSKPRIAIVGAGNLARALGPCLRDAGYAIDEIVVRAGAASLRSAARLARDMGTSAVTVARSRLRAEIVWFCVPDGSIRQAAESLAESTDWRGKVALHSSGALTSDELAALRRRGASVASAHPLMTFVRGSRPALTGVSFAIEGDPKAVPAARGIVRHLRGKPFAIRKRDKEVYHAWGMFVSPLLTALLAAGERVAAAAGVPRGNARGRALPILQQTLANYSALGAAESFSGPFARGDVDTVKKHLRVLQKIPGMRDVYVALLLSALRDLPAKNRNGLEKILKGG